VQPGTVVGSLREEFAQQSGQEHGRGDLCQDGVDQLVLVAEVPVDDGLGDAGAAGDVVDGEVRTGLPHRLHPGRDQVSAPRAPVLGPA
jgi:hypothetical protein